MYPSLKQHVCKLRGLRSRDLWEAHSALWELGSTETDVQRIYFELTWNIVCLGERDPVFLCFISKRNILFYIWVRHFEGGVAHEESPKVALNHLCRCWDSGLLQANESSCEIEQPSGIALVYRSLARLPVSCAACNLHWVWISAALHTLETPFLPKVNSLNGNKFFTVLWNSSLSGVFLSFKCL